MNLLKNNIFFLFIIIFGLLNAYHVLNINFSSNMFGDFKSSKILGQIDQYFILIPFLIIFFQSLTKKSLFYPALGILAVMWTKNIIAIFITFIISEIFLIERRRENLKICRREFMILTLALVPISFFWDKIFASSFIFLFVLVGVFDSFSSSEKDNSLREKIEEIILFLPLRMTIIVYYTEIFLPGWGVMASKTVLSILLLSLLLYSLNSRFHLGIIVAIAQILFLMMSLSILNSFFIEIYFLGTMILIFSIENNKLHRSLLEVSLIIFLSAFDQRINLLKFISTSLHQDLYSLGISSLILFFLSLLVIRAGYGFKENKENKKENIGFYPIFIMVAFAAVGIIGSRLAESTGRDFITVEWRSRVILGAYFILIFLLPSVIDLPLKSLKRNKKIEKFFKGVGTLFLNGNIICHLFSSFRGFLKIITDIFIISYSLVQKFFVDLVLLLSHIARGNRYRKYQHLVTFLLLVYLFLCSRILTGF